MILICILRYEKFISIVHTKFYYNSSHYTQLFDYFPTHSCLWKQPQSSSFHSAIDTTVINRNVTGHEKWYQSPIEKIKTWPQFCYKSVRPSWFSCKSNSDKTSVGFMRKPDLAHAYQSYVGSQRQKHSQSTSHKGWPTATSQRTHAWGTSTLLFMSGV
jgi:hypothetical protein